MPIELRPIRQRTLRERIVEQLKEFIIANNLRPGDRLPTEKELSESFGVSRTIVREAFRLLEGIGVLETRPKQGAILKEPDRRPLQELFWFFVTRYSGSISDIWEARQVFESAILPFVAKWATDEDWQEMKTTIDEMNAALKRGEIGLEEDRRFHAALAQATHNPILQGFAEVIAEFFRKVQEQALTGSKEVREAALREHRQMFNALRQGDIAKAQEIMRCHLERPIRLGIIPAPKHTKPAKSS